MEMIERCAKAIYAKLNDEMRGDGYLSDSSDDMTDVVVDGRVDLLAVARVAIESIREPTEPMLAAVKPEPTHLYSSRSEDYQQQMKKAVAISRLGFESEWRTAIDAALKEQEKA
jgi:hypothetical protein